MPEYLSPGVYVEEVSFRAKSLEGVPTSTTGFAGMAAFGPVQYPGGPKTSEPRLIGSFTEYERVYGGLTPLELTGVKQPRLPYMSHAARAFFMNGGRRLYISRVFKQPSDGLTKDVPNFECVGTRTVPVGGNNAIWRARWPGAAGNVHVAVEFVRSRLVPYISNSVVQLKGPSAGSIIEAWPAATATTKLPGGTEYKSDPTKFAVVTLDNNGVQQFTGSGPFAVSPTDFVYLVELRVKVTVGPERIDVYDRLAAHQDQVRYIGRILEKDDPEDENAVVWLDWKPSPDPAEAVRLALALVDNATPRLTGGTDGALADHKAIAGREADLDVPSVKATGLAALGEIDDIAIVAIPDGGDQEDDERAIIVEALITHCVKLKYRIAVVDGPRGASVNEIRKFRGRFDTKYAALYHPWIEILDPTQRPAQGAPQQRLLLPPSGFVCGIYARNDIERGVHKAPANEVVRGLTKFEININTARQDVLNPEGVNCLRFFEGRGNRVWGARTMSSDPEWKYVNVRRIFIYLEHTLDKGSQFAVFEPNDEVLWGNIKRMVSDFLLVMWRDGALLGDRPEDAYFVTCDRTTMLQNDLDNGRMICEVGVAPVKPAEFVIFRVGQWTANANQ